MDVTLKYAGVFGPVLSGEGGSADDWIFGSVLSGEGGSADD